MRSLLSKLRALALMLTLLTGVALSGPAAAGAPGKGLYRRVVAKAQRLRAGVRARRLCRREVKRIGKEVRAGKKVCVVFDIDNTLVDTRHRTLGAAKAFAAAHPKVLSPKKVRMGKVRYDGAQTAEALKLPGAQRGAFATFWRSFFWNTKNFHLDKAIPQTTAWAHAAKRAGAEVYYLTGRIDALKDGSIRQLAALGLPDADAAHVLCKPSVKVRTPDFKRQELKKLQRGKRVAWFVSDAASDLGAAKGLGIGCVLVEFPVGPGTHKEPTLPAATPRLRPTLAR